MTKLKSLGYYTQSLNTGAEYAIREDGAVFSRSKSWNDRFRNFTVTKWKRDSYWDNCEEMKGCPERATIGFSSDFVFVPSTRLRLPQPEEV